MNASRAHRARRRAWRRRYTIGPFSYHERLKAAAVGDMVCRYIVVTRDG